LSLVIRGRTGQVASEAFMRRSRRGSGEKVTRRSRMNEDWGRQRSCRCCTAPAHSSARLPALSLLSPHLWLTGPITLRPCLLLRYFYPQKIWGYVGIWCLSNTLKFPQILFPKNTLPWCRVFNLAKNTLE
jgi:hypothetical protein